MSISQNRLDEVRERLAVELVELPLLDGADRC
jgi:hypothetical protein